jgi:nitrate reductase alpha subunit
MGWIKDIISPKQRGWEEFYRNRWQYDKVVRSTHGVNCTGGCSWMVHVKDGIVVWELQATDYYGLGKGIPPYEPRGCQRGISFSWYLYSPIRVKYPYIRRALIDLWKEAKEKKKDPVSAWTSIVEDEDKRRRYQNVRGKGGFVRIKWDEILEIIAASTIYTVKKWGPDRVVGFSPIPAMSMLSYSSGARFLELLGGVCLSFYDWYCDLPPASPEIWGEQTDVGESADWYNSKYIAVMGSNLSMTRTPDVHFVAEARHNGTKLIVFSPDFSQVSKYADWWIPINGGQDGAFWMAVNHVILKEYYHEKRIDYFEDYIKKYTDASFLVILEKKGEDFKAGRFLTASLISEYKTEENSDFKFLTFDKNKNKVRMPLGTLGFRWQKEKGKWNLKMKDGKTGEDIDPLLSFIDLKDEVLLIEIPDFSDNKIIKRGVPVKYIETENGKVAVTTVFDLLMAQFGVKRGIEGDYPEGYGEDKPYTPLWQEKFSGIKGDTLIRFAREWAETSNKTGGRCSIIIGAGVNHYYHNNLIYRAGIVALMLAGCIGKNGGGLNHYVGQEKIVPIAPWSQLAFAFDWIRPPRLMNTPSFHYVHSDQWRYEGEFNEYCPVSEDTDISKGHTMDIQAKAVRMGWLPFYPQFNKNPIDIVEEARKDGCKDQKEIVNYVVEKLKKGEIKFSVSDPDAPENWPRVWFIWRGNALMSSAKGHEYFLKHYLGTHSNVIADEIAKDSVKEIVFRDKAPEGKFDLIVDINFRMDTSAIYSDIILPTATWYEKNDLNTTDLHSFIHPLQEVVPPCWESKTDWDIFKDIAKKVSELAENHFPDRVQDIVSPPLLHDTPDELAQREIKDWAKGECEPIPGKTMPKLIIVERDYKNLYKRFISFGPLAKNMGIGAHGISWKIDDLYEELLKNYPVEEWGGERYPSLKKDVDAANVILYLAPETNGVVSYRAFQVEEEKVGLPLKDLVEGVKDVRYDFDNIVSQPRRVLTSPCWSGITNNGRAYSSYCMNVERFVPWRTLTGRQQFYIDHPGYIVYGENLPTYKPRLDYRIIGDVTKSDGNRETLLLNYLTPHGKWHIHSTYSDNLRMLTLSRGCDPLWINNKDAEKIGIKDNDWVEVYNDHGVVVTRAVISARIPQGICLLYHSPERTISVPKSPKRMGRRAGGHNSLIRTRLKPVLMMGGYGQFTWFFNYWGPTGVNRDTFVYVRKLIGRPKF